ncbi:hypothetical protein WME94_45615 [Sorangium sp. So ce429]
MLYDGEAVYGGLTEKALKFAQAGVTKVDGVYGPNARDAMKSMPMNAEIGDACLELNQCRKP